LTIELARNAGNVIAVELDTNLASLLKRRLSSLANLRVINADILKVNPSQLLEGKNKYKVVANLPYYITSPVLRYFVEASPKPSLMVVMVQKEVGEAIVAGPGNMSLLAISLQVYSKPRIISHVPSICFYPQPKVDSVILRFDVLPEPAVKVADINGFFGVVKCGFSSPRKQLHNSLAHGLGVKPTEVALLLEQVNVDPKRRAETLSLEEWAKLYEAWAVSKRDEMKC
jgi:16S rRNA (adenine1518-N6/adenine1519-N6)-dimethyltransferase